MMVIATGIAQTAQNRPPNGPNAVITGTIRDSNGRSVAETIVTLTAKASGRTFVAHTDSKGLYRFSAIEEGAYSIRAVKSGAGETAASPLLIKASQVKQLDLTLTTERAAEPQPATPKPAFFDEPTFTVAGVTDTTVYGGHGSEGNLRSTESLVKATGTLGKTPPGISSPSSADIEKTLRQALQRKPENFEANFTLGKFLLTDGKPRESLPYLKHAETLEPDRADLHQLMGDANEQLGDALGAVREYKRAVQLDANETNLFDWGAELLAHRAAEPAVEVFNRGHRLFPDSSRMLLGLAAAWYARGNYNQAAPWFFEACDINPSDAVPYLFMAKAENTEITHLEGFRERLERFTRLQPDSAWARYYYAVSLWNVRKDPGDADAGKVVTLLEQAIRLDPNLGVAYLQLGVLHSDRRDYTNAVAAYQKAVQVSPDLEQAHYRLARTYTELGNEQEARKELSLFEQLSKKSAARANRERSELQQFVFALRGSPNDPPGHQSPQ